ncbi:MAG TPA: cation:proton antiporter [Sporichthyaceae bacterium]
MLDAPLAAHFVSVALVLILFDGGGGLGAARPGRLWRPILTLGLPGTVLSAAGLAAGAHWLLGFDWHPALLLGAAFAPTDPAVVFALVRESHTERSAVGLVLEGESGANDIVGIVLAATLGFAFAGYSLTDLLNSSVFLPAFTAGIWWGHRGGRSVPTLVVRAARVAAFGVLALTLHPDVLRHTNVWGPGLALGALAAFVVRPAAVALCLAGSAFSVRERAILGWVGLKGAVPLLLGLQLVVHNTPAAPRLYGVVVIAVLFSLFVQGGTVAPLLRRLTSPA